MNLSTLQRNFRDWLVSSSSEATLRQLGTSTTAGLDVYQNNYRGQLVGCLESSFPQLRAWLGQEVFLETAIAHIDSHPPHAWTLDAYGLDFDETLQARFPHNPDLHELAWIEWALSESFVAADVTPMSSDEWQTVDWDTARICLHPGLRQRTATTNAEAIWSALQDGAQPPESEMLPSPRGLIVWRHGYTSRLRLVDTIEHEALLSLREDNRFITWCDALVDHLGEEAGVGKAGQLFADWLAAGIVTGTR
ncbi:putative DNA-binding domain-containing protein [Dyella halodurans]|uniref:DNA-binding domain-containing protein n=1 Tax=Dyella halodurans TaxID=1920171 RepID=A0ABV9C4Z6_9GAMM|nr:DNA-binding domain-containing protein [Dyella halodurans]